MESSVGPIAGTVIWQVWHDKDLWRDMTDTNLVQKLEESLRLRAVAVEYTWPYDNTTFTPYKIDLDQMTQTNLESKFVRKIRRVRVE